MPRMTSFPVKPKFDPARDYIVQRTPFTCAGVTYEIYSPFDKNSVPLRRLRQLYDCCIIQMVKQDTPEAPRTKRIKRVQLEPALADV